MTPRFTSHSSRRGVALVITLILLSVILVVTFALLAVSRRERSSVTTAQHLIDAEYMANAALERAKATVASQMLGHSNLMAGGFGRPIYAPEISPDPTLSTPLDARVGGDLVVSVVATTNWPDPSQYLQSLTNLQYDARVPVFVRTNRVNLNAPFESRHFLDLNRNGMFESNGFFSLFDPNEQVIGTNRFFHSGDPEWIGVLAQPGLNHSATNRFIGRYAYMILPAGRTLDLNSIHNSAKRDADIALGNEGYGRNQGYGTYELNLAAFLVDLNTNQWLGVSGYRFDLPAPWGAGGGIGAGDGSGVAFDHARDLLRYRYGGRRSNLPTLLEWGGNRIATAFQSDLLDSYADDTTAEITDRLIGLPVFDNDPAGNDPNTRWPGVVNTNRFVSYEDLFKPRVDTNKATFIDPLKPPYFGNFTRSLKLASAGKGTYNRYTFYRLLSQLGTDTGPGPEGRLNLSYVNIGGTPVSDMVPWQPTNFFMEVANRLIHRTISDAATTNRDINRERYSTNFAHFVDPTNGLVPIFYGSNSQKFVYLEQLGTNVVRNLGATNIPIYPTNFYNSAIHRLLQLAANLHEPSAVTNIAFPKVTVPENHAAYLPTVYRPTFARRGNSIVIQGYIEDDGFGLDTYPWYTIEGLNVRMTQNGESVVTDANVYGVPPIVAARKGMPSLNEVSLTTGVRLARRLEVTKNDPKDDLLTKPYRLRESFSLSSANRFGIELLNSYTSTYPRKVNVKVHGRLVTTFMNDNQAFLRITNLIGSPSVIWTNFAAGTWTGGDLNSKSGIRVAMLTNLVTIPQVILTPDDASGQTRVSLRYDTNNIFVGAYDKFVTPRLTCRSIMDLGCLVYDAESKASVPVGRIIDAISFGGTSVYFDINSLLQGTKSSSGIVGGSTSSKRRIWDPTPVGGNRSSGVSNQVHISWNGNNVSDINSIWSPVFINLFSRNSAIDKYNFFHRGLMETNRAQAPFSADTDLFQNYRWQANDPLLHHIPDQMPVELDTVDFRYGSANNAPSNFLASLVLVASTNLWDPGTPNLKSHKPWPSSTTPSQLDRFDPYLRDPMVRSPDDWEFPTNHLPNLGAIGAIHRGSPWQTIFLKSAGPDNEGKWLSHMGGNEVFKQAVVDDPSKHIFTNVWFSFPTNDWSLVDMFTVGASDNAGAGMVGVNQGGLAAWSAVLSGVVVLTNHVELKDAELRFNQNNPRVAPALGFAAIQPALVTDPASLNSSPLVKIVNGINSTRTNLYYGLFGGVGQILSVPQLTMASPFLRQSPGKLTQVAISEQAYEQIPRQILSLIRADEPRFVIYSFGQALLPAQDSLIKNPTSPFFNLCTNYQVTAETATKTVVRFVDVGDKSKSPQMILKPIIESFEQLPPDGL